VGGVSPLPAPHWRFSETPAHIRLPSPFPGEHDSYVLQQLLGLSQGEVEDLRRKGIIAGAASR
ncbi:MAG TPA: CoA transferase, partial [Dehalococcoidia bacterium]|nr:CoA transferase [Dehalococcoidia bacterium]